MGMDGYQTYRGEHFTTYTNIKSRSSAPDINIISYTNGGTSGKESACQCRRCRRHGFDPWVRKIPWKRKRHPTPVFLPGESHRQRSLAGCSS